MPNDTRDLEMRLRRCRSDEEALNLLDREIEDLFTRALEDVTCYGPYKRSPEQREYFRRRQQYYRSSPEYRERERVRRKNWAK